ncbi:hypothetical protein [Aquitalea sp. ASV15]|uniref:hypothetical protein n=1 Tax=Aquitalea sp. ASV15 TaxID=2795104 RepID=UPI0018EE42AA|nr:hypothetical protein [Aquitalea sp. ASV15]
MTISSLGSYITSSYTSTNDIKISSSATIPSKSEDKLVSSDTVVTISSTSKNLSENANNFENIGLQARAKLDSLIKATAQKNGVTPQAVNIGAMSVSDYSVFSDQELAAMSLNSSKNFLSIESDQARGALAARVAVSLKPYQAATNAGDRRGHTMAINALYDSMTPEIRHALGWTPVMMEETNLLLESDTKKFGKLDQTGVLNHLKHASSNGGISIKIS